jgi:dipeptidyl aminopeptidase/acylaminoacyl peptidase
MKFWLVVLGMTAVLVAGSVALAGNNEPTTPTGPLPTAQAAKPTTPTGPLATAQAAKPATPKATPTARAAQPKPVVTRALPSNGLIAASAKGAIVLVDPANGRVTEVPGTAGMDKPAWSPDGRLLAVERASPGTSVAAGGTSVYTIRPDGTHAQLVLKDASSPSWSEDGSRLFVERDTCTAPGGCDESEDETTVVFTVAPDGSDEHELGEDDVYDPNEAGWPAENHALSFLEDEGSSAPAEVDSSQASWSPDGFELAIADASTGLWIVSVDGGKPELVAAGAYGSPSWGVGATAPAAQSARR